MLEGSTMALEDPVTDWATVTGSSPLRVQIKIGALIQRMSVWDPAAGLRDLGEIELDGKSFSEAWGLLRRNFSGLMGSDNYDLFQGQTEIQWRDLPLQNVTAVPKLIPTLLRGASFNICDHLQTPRLREAGHLVQANLQVFSMEGSEATEVMGIVVPNEITLAQLVTYLVLPTGIELDVDSAFYWHLPRIEDPSEPDKTKWKVEEVPDKIPHGFLFKVRCSSLHDGSTKQLAHCRFGSVLMHFSMPLMLV
jgi:hypothetical protein